MELKKLKQVATVTSGYPFRGKIPEVADTNIVAVQMKDVSPVNGIHWLNCVATAPPGKRPPDWLSPGDILVAARGNHYYAVLVDEKIREAGLQAVAAPHFFVVRCVDSVKPTAVLSEYLVWLLNRGPCQRYFEQNAEGTQTKSIRRKVLEDVPIAVPAPARQRAIVGLSNALRQEQRAMNKLLSNSERLLNSIASDLLAPQGAL